MLKNGEKKMVNIYSIILYFLFLISWAFLIHRDYSLTVCQSNLVKSSSLIDIWAQLTPVPKFLTIVLGYITVHAAVAGIIAIKNSKKPQRTGDA